MASPDDLHAMRFPLLRAALIAAAAATCAPRVTEPSADDGVAILFVGNSLTYFNALPGMVQALADSAGQRTPRVAQVAFPDFSLEDHWNHGAAAREIARGDWDVVVLQQGPSARPESRVLLLEYARRFADAIRATGARPALYMVWPQANRSFDFDRAVESWVLAADSVGGILLPVAEAWRAAWRRDPAAPLYAADGLHPTAAGSYLAALVMAERLLGVAPVGLPARIDVRGGGRVAIPPELAPILQQAAAEANGALVSR